MKKTLKLAGLLAGALLFASCSSPAGGGGGSSSSSGTLTGSVWLWGEKSAVEVPGGGSNPGGSGQQPGGEDNQQQGGGTGGGGSDGGGTGGGGFNPEPQTETRKRLYLYFADSEYAYIGTFSTSVTFKEKPGDAEDEIITDTFVKDSENPLYAAKYTVEDGTVKFDFKYELINDKKSWLPTAPEQKTVTVEDYQAAYTNIEKALGLFKTPITYSKGNELTLKSKTDEQKDNGKAYNWKWSKNKYDVNKDKLCASAKKEMFNSIGIDHSLFISDLRQSSFEYEKDYYFFTIENNKLVTGLLIKNTSDSFGADYKDTYAIKVTNDVIYNKLYEYDSKFFSENKQLLFTYNNGKINIAQEQYSGFNFKKEYGTISLLNPKKCIFVTSAEKELLTGKKASEAKTARVAMGAGEPRLPTPVVPGPGDLPNVPDVGPGPDTPVEVKKATALTEYFKDYPKLDQDVSTAYDKNKAWCYQGVSFNVSDTANAWDGKLNYTKGKYNLKFSKVPDDWKSTFALESDYELIKILPYYIEIKNAARGVERFKINKTDDSISASLLDILELSYTFEPIIYN